MSSFSTVTSKRFARGVSELRTIFRVPRDEDGSPTAIEEFETLLDSAKKDGELSLSNLLSKAEHCSLNTSKIRSVYWKIYLACLSLDSSQWESQLSQRRKFYQSMHERYVSASLTGGVGASGPGSSSQLTDTAGDDPLAAGKGSMWDGYFQDRSLRERIELDVDRTFGEFTLFKSSKVKNSLTDVLFVYAKLYPNVEYHQGMNEILAVLFAVNLLYSDKVFDYSVDPVSADEPKAIPVTDESLVSDEQESVHSSSDSRESSNEEETSAVAVPMVPEFKPRTIPVTTSSQHSRHLWSVLNDCNFVEHDSFAMFEVIMECMAEHFSNTEGSRPSSSFSLRGLRRRKSEKGPMSPSRASESTPSIKRSESMKLAAVSARLTRAIGGSSESSSVKDKPPKVPPIVQRAQRVQQDLLRRVDPQLSTHLEALELSPQLYGMRWMRLFYTREYHIRDVLVIWDSIFGVYCDDRYQLEQSLKQKQWRQFVAASKDSSSLKKTREFRDDWKHVVLNESSEEELLNGLSFSMVDYTAVSMLLYIRSSLLEGDVNVALHRVMKYPPVESVSSIVTQAFTVRCAIEADAQQRRRLPKTDPRSPDYNDAKPEDQSGSSSTVAAAGSSAAAALMAGVDSLLGGTAVSDSSSLKGGSAQSASSMLSDRWKQFSGSVTKVASQALGLDDDGSGADDSSLHKQLQNRVTIERALAAKLNTVLLRIEQTMSANRDGLVDKIIVYESTEEELITPVKKTEGVRDDDAAAQESSVSLVSVDLQDSITENISPHNPILPVPSVEEESTSLVKKTETTTDVKTSSEEHSSDTLSVDALLMDDFDDPLTADSAAIDRVQKKASRVAALLNRDSKAKTSAAAAELKSKAESTTKLCSVKSREKESVQVLEESIAEIKLIRDALNGQINEDILFCWLGISEDAEHSSAMKQSDVSPVQKPVPHPRRLPPPPPPKRRGGGGSSLLPPPRIPGLKKKTGAKPSWSGVSGSINDRGLSGGTVISSQTYSS